MEWHESHTLTDIYIYIYRLTCTSGVNDRAVPVIRTLSAIILYPNPPCMVQHDTTPLLRGSVLRLTMVFVCVCVYVRGVYVCMYVCIFVCLSVCVYTGWKEGHC